MKAIWEDFKHRNGISKEISFSLNVEHRLGAHYGKEIQLSGTPQEVRDKFLLGCVTERKARH